MGEEKNDLEESMRKIAREVIDERVTKIKFGAQILRTVREVMDEESPKVSGGVSVDDIRSIAKWLYLEYAGIAFMLGGSLSGVVAIAIPMILSGSVVDPLVQTIILNQIIGLILGGVSTILLGLVLYQYSKSKYREIKKKSR